MGEDTTAYEPPPIRHLSAPELKALIEGGTAFQLVDVRTDAERAVAKMDGSRLLDQSHRDALLSLDPNTLIVFQCHHGIRSQHAALVHESGVRFRGSRPDWMDEVESPSHL